MKSKTIKLLEENIIFVTLEVLLPIGTILPTSSDFPAKNIPSPLKGLAFPPVGSVCPLPHG